jgi:hypothetical protein
MNTCIAGSRYCHTGAVSENRKFKLIGWEACERNVRINLKIL